MICKEKLNKRKLLQEKIQSDIKSQENHINKIYDILMERDCDKNETKELIQDLCKTLNNITSAQKCMENLKTSRLVLRYIRTR